MTDEDNRSWVIKNTDRIKEENQLFTEIQKNMNPFRTSLRIGIIYLIFGGAWILLSDRILLMLVKNNEVYAQIQLFKGWFYVIVTAVIFIFMFKKALDDYKVAVERILGSHRELNEAYELMMSMNEELDESNERFKFLAFYDSLTKLPNRHMFRTYVQAAIEKEKEFAILSLDLDNMKHINDMYGQKAGDEYLEFIGERLSELIVGEDVVARLNGNQFAVLMISPGDSVFLKNRLKGLQKILQSEWEINEQKIYSSASIGIARYPEHGKEYQELIQNAEIAMYNRKENGKNGYEIFNHSMQEKVLNFIFMRNSLHEAIENEDFELYYQPLIEVKTEKITGVEALIRWRHKERGFIPPMEFIPIAEKTGHILPITMIVLRTAVNQLMQWREKGYCNLKVAVNVSGHIIEDVDMVRQICQMALEAGIPRDNIEIEVTETAIMRNLEKAAQSLEEIHAQGITIAMDDFGTGYSSLTNLHKLPFDVLKIDKDFINTIEKDEEGYIYKAIIHLAHNMGLSVVAEGVETEDQYEFLKESNCDSVQGYYFSRPLPVSEIESLLEREYKEKENAC